MSVLAGSRSENIRGDESIESLCACESEEAERRVAFEELVFWDEAGGGLEVVPTFGGHRRWLS